MEGEYRFGEVQVFDMILTVSWRPSCTGKGNEGWKIADDPKASPRLGDAMSCEPAVEVGASGSRQVKNSTSNSKDRALVATPPR